MAFPYAVTWTGHDPKVGEGAETRQVLGELAVGWAEGLGTLYAFVCQRTMRPEVTMFARTFVGSSFALAALLAAGQPARASSRTHEPPGVSIWTNHGGVYRRAARVQVFFRTERDAYVTVLRVDTNGRVRVLFPPEPGDSNFARGGETYAVAGADSGDTFVVDDAPGAGYVFAVASQDPFAYDAFTDNDHWSFEAIASSREPMPRTWRATI